MYVGREREIQDPKLEYMQDPTVMRISLHKDPMYMRYITDPYMQDPTVVVSCRPNTKQIYPYDRLGYWYGSDNTA